jgi:hypothetical protein
LESRHSGPPVHFALVILKMGEVSWNICWLWPWSSWCQSLKWLELLASATGVWILFFFLLCIENCHISGSADTKVNKTWALTSRSQSAAGNDLQVDKQLQYSDKQGLWWGFIIKT